MYTGSFQAAVDDVDALVKAMAMMLWRFWNQFLCFPFTWRNHSHAWALVTMEITKRLPHKHSDCRTQRLSLKKAPVPLKHTLQCSTLFMHGAVGVGGERCCYGHLVLWSTAIYLGNSSSSRFLTRPVNFYGRSLSLGHSGEAKTSWSLPSTTPLVLQHHWRREGKGGEEGGGEAPASSCRYRYASDKRPALGLPFPWPPFPCAQAHLTRPVIVTEINWEHDLMVHRWGDKESLLLPGITPNILSRKQHSEGGWQCEYFPQSVGLLGRGCTSNWRQAAEH